MNNLPDFPWDRLEPYKARAQAHPDGIVDLSVGTPVDPVPRLVQDALVAAADSPGYPLTHGTKALREAAAGWLRRRHGVTVGESDVLPLIGSKEFVAWLPTYLGAGHVVFPELAYPTYDVGARLAGARSTAADGLLALGPERVDLVWVNSPGNPTGKVLPAEHLRKVVSWARNAARSSPRTSATWSSAGKSSRSRSCIPTSAAAPTRGCWPSTRSPSARTWPATAPGSSPATPLWSSACWRCASTAAC